jgi:uncharacterized protein (TIRG00374 family)
MPKMFKNARRWLPGAIISLVLVALILYFVDLRKMVEAVRKANYWLLLAALIGSALWMVLRAIVWRTLLQKRAPLKDVYLCLCEGYLMNNFLPFRLGEFGRAFLLSRKSDMTFMEILPTVVIERSFDLFITAAIFLISLPFVVNAAGSEKIAWVVGGVVLIGLVVLFLMARYQQRALEIFNRLSARWPKLQQLGGNFLESFFAGLAVLTDSHLFVQFILWMSLNWLLAIVQYFLIVRAFFPQAQPIWAMFGLGAAAFGGAVPSLPGAVGTFDAAFGGALVILAGEQFASTALTAALTARLYNYTVSGVPALYALSTEGETLAGLYRQLTRFRSKEESASEQPQE